MRGRGKRSAQAGNKAGGKSGQQGGNQNQNNGQAQGRPGGGLGGGPGVGSRPFRQVADEGFRAEQAKGNLQNGAITGIAHFRGQGTKGQAPVEFVQALEAIEKDPSSALELERVPRDARDVVRDYFLKVREATK